MTTYTHQSTEQSLSALTRVLSSVHRAQTPQELAHTALASILEASACTSGSVWLRDHETLRCVAFIPAQPNLQALEPPSILQSVVADGQPSWSSPTSSQQNEQNTYIPLIARGIVIGGLHVTDSQAEPPSTLLLACAEVLASALQAAQLTELVEAQQHELRSIKRQHDELISIISHDLKNPMASIKGYADLLLRRSTRTPDDPNRRGLQVISEQVVRMTEMLDALLDVSRMSSARLKLDQRPADLSEVVRELVEGLRDSESDHALLLEDAGQSYPGVFDRARIRQAIEQVVQNALRFSPPGRPVELVLRRDGDSAILAVQDHGVGISAADRERIFEPFFRANTAAGQAGMGLGLFIAQQILLSHAGQIWCDSEEGRGATFFLALPLAPDGHQPD